MSESDGRIRISPEQAKKQIENSNVTVLDVVDTHAYDEVGFKLPGAVRIDPGKVPAEYDRLPKGRPVLTYCT